MTERIEIEMPDGTIIDAPAGVTQAQVMARYQKANQQKPAPQQSKMFGPWASAAIRPVAKAVAGLPLMAMDAGVGVRNFATNENYEMPSSMFNKALDSYTTPPEGLGKGAEFVSTMLAGSRLPAPQVKNPAPAAYMAPRDAARAAALRSAQKDGFVTPPSSGNPTIGNRVLEGIAGKDKLGQEAIIRNQGTVEKLAASGVQQSADSVLTPGALQTIRKDAFDAGYAPLRNLGKVTTGDAYNKALDAITAATKGAERSFPGLTSGNQAVTKAVDALRKNEFDSADAVDAIKFLRESADDAYRAGQGSSGRAFRDAAKALEKAIEDELASRGEKGADLLKKFRESRQLIAQTHTAEKALVGESGASNAQAYASALKSRKPLTGDQRKIADFAQTFSKYAPKPKGENYTPLGPLDVYGSAGLSVGMDSIAPFAYPLTRIGLRKFLLSPQGQAMAIPKGTPGPQQSMGLLGGVLPQVNPLLGQ